jgi:hypothetical protein
VSKEHPIEVRDMAIVHRLFLIERPWKKYAATLRTGT